MFYNCVRLEDINVKFGPNPGDRIAVIQSFATLGASNVVSTPFAPGTSVLVVPFIAKPVDANGDITIGANEEPASGGSGGFMVIGLGHQTQGGVSP